MSAVMSVVVRVSRSTGLPGVGLVGVWWLVWWRVWGSAGVWLVSVWVVCEVCARVVRLSGVLQWCVLHCVSRW